MSLRVWVIVLLMSCLVVSWGYAAEEIIWEMPTGFADGTKFTPEQRRDLRFPIYVGPSPSAMKLAKADVRRPPVAVVDIPEITMSMYIGVEVELDGTRSPMAVIRYQLPGAVEGLRTASSPLAFVPQDPTLKWLAVTNYSDGALLTDDDQRLIRYRVFTGDYTGRLTMVLEGLVQPLVSLVLIENVPDKPFVSVAAYLGSFQGPTAPPIPRKPAVSGSVQP